MNHDGSGQPDPDDHDAFDWDSFLAHLPENPKTLDELMAEGKLRPEVYRSILFLMKACGNGFSYPATEPIDIDQKIAELTVIIDRGGKSSFSES